MIRTRHSNLSIIAAPSLSILTLGAGLSAIAAPLSPQAAVRPAAPSQQELDAIIADAAQRFDMPERIISAVIKAESSGDPHAVSRAGAMGLMQIMPSTWRELRTALGLGEDSFDPRENVLAGAAYLRAMYDRFGAPGFLAAYHAGPGRYADHLATGRPLPHETRVYLATLAPVIGGAVAEVQPTYRPPIVSDWRAAPLFVAQTESTSDALREILDESSEIIPPSTLSPNRTKPLARSDGLFVRNGRGNRR